MECVICYLETEPKKDKGTEFAVFKKTVPALPDGLQAPDVMQSMTYGTLSAVDCSMRSFFKLEVWRVQFGKFARS